MQDLYARKRERMVREQIAARGLRRPNILSAFLTVPRHEFVPHAYRDQAYYDYPLSIGEGQTISQPFMVALMTAAAEVCPGDRVLEVGTGSGYQAAILATLGAEVYTIERLSALSQAAREVVTRLGYTNIHFLVGDGTLGWKEEAPFDACIVTAGAPAIPPPLQEQLAVGGRLVIPVEEGFCQVLHTIRRTPHGFETTRGERCTFVPLLGKYGWNT